MKQFQKLEGLISATFTPFDKNGKINPEVIPEYANYIISKGITGVFINGTTGEWSSLTTEERKIIAEKWVSAINGRVKVIIHVGGFCLPQSVELSEHAQEIGADAIASIAPSFFKPATIHDLVHFFKPIAQAAPELPFYYYNMPSMTGVDLSVEKFLEVGKNEISTLAGVKFTHNNLHEMALCLNYDNGSFQILHGYDETLITGLALGAVAGVGSTYNYLAPVYLKIMDAVKTNDLTTARLYQMKSAEMVRIIIKYGGGVRGGKAVMNLAGINCGPCRLPISQLSDSEYNLLKADLEQFGFFNN